MKTTYRAHNVVVVDTEDTSDTYLDAEKPISTRLFSAKVAWALLHPVDCSYTLVFSSEGKVPCTVNTPEEYAERKDTLPLFAAYDKVTIKNLCAVEPKPEGPYCTAAGKYLYIHAGTRSWNWVVSGTIYTRNLSTADIAALCNPYRCEARVNAFTKDNALVSYFSLGTLTPEEMLKYERFALIAVRGKEH